MAVVAFGLCPDGTVAVAGHGSPEPIEWMNCVYTITGAGVRKRVPSVSEADQKGGAPVVKSGCSRTGVRILSYRARPGEGGPRACPSVSEANRKGVLYLDPPILKGVHWRSDLR